MRINGDRLEVLLPGGGPTLMDGPLDVFYADDGSPIGSCFRLISDDVYGFELEGYDPTREVTIDPLIYSTYIGGSRDDRGQSLVLDSSGNVYVTGAAESTNFPTTSGAYNTSNNGDHDVFVAKMNSGGNSLLYSTYVGSSYYDFGFGIG